MAEAVGLELRASATSPQLVLLVGDAEAPLDSAVVELVEHAAAGLLGTSEVRVTRLSGLPATLRDAAWRTATPVGGPVS